MPIHYVPPSPEDLRRLKESLGYTGEQMADLFGLAGNNQWRKYTGGTEPRRMSLPMLFLVAGVLHPNKRASELFDWCREVGAVIEFRESE